MSNMANFPLKLLVSYLQIRCLQTNVSNLVKKTLKPVTAAREQIQSENSERAAALLVKKESVIALLKKQHFSDTQIAKLAEKNPMILRCKVKTTLEPKFKFLNENGFKGSVLTELITRNPLILRRSLRDHLIPSLKYVRELMQNNAEALLFVVKRATWLLTLDLEKILQPNIDLMFKEGVPMSSILKLFTSQPRTLLCSVDRMAYGLESVKKFGIKPSNAMFIHCLRVLLSMNELNLKKKVEVLKSLGWSDKDLMTTVARQPLCLTCSEVKLRRNMEFFVKTMEVEPATIIAYPKLVMYSLDRRSIPRCEVLRALKKKKLLKSVWLPGLINMSETDFIRKYIMKYQTQAPQLLTIYHGKLKKEGIAVQ